MSTSEDRNAAFDIIYIRNYSAALCVWKRIDKPVPLYWEAHICPACQRCKEHWRKDDERGDAQ